jgi:hypothetical protein
MKPKKFTGRFSKKLPAYDPYAMTTVENCLEEMMLTGSVIQFEQWLTPKQQDEAIAIMPTRSMEQLRDKIVTPNLKQIQKRADTKLDANAITYFIAKSLEALIRLKLIDPPPADGVSEGGKS